MGAVSVSIKKRTGILPTGTARIADITMSSSYATGGDTFTASQFELRSIDAILIVGAGGRLLEPDIANSKILAYEDGATVSGALDQVPAATNLSTVVARALIIGDLANI